MGALGLASMTIPTVVIKDIAEGIKAQFSNGFDPNEDYAMGVTVRCDNESVQSGLDFVRNNLKRCIPPRYRNRVEFRRVNLPFERYAQIGFCYSPKNSQGYMGTKGEWVYDQDKGVYIWRRIKQPFVIREYGYSIAYDKEKITNVRHIES